MKNIVKIACATSLLAITAAVPVMSDVAVDLDVLMQDKKPEKKPAPKPVEKKPVVKKTDAKKVTDKKDVKKDAKKKKPKKPKFKKYEEVITKKAVTSKGIFTTHMVDGKVYFEIPNDKFGKEFVWQVKISAVQTKKGTISEDSARQYVNFERKGDKVLLRARDYSVVSKDGAPISFVVNASDIDAILASYKIVTFGKDKTPVIDITSAYLDGIKELSGLRGAKMDKKVSTVEQVKSFERNIETRVLGKFSRKGKRGTENVTAEIRHSILALPDVPMKPRFYDKRVGYFDAGYTDYSGVKNKLDSFRYIKRWRLEKKDPTAAISEPKKPITWYVDRGTPAKYIEAVREGIEFWKPAFEAAGFKNGIVAKIAPSVKEDPNWDPEDARYSVVRWVPSATPNANGPHVADPRTGEIIEADVRMYHNVVKLLEEWYFAQAGATDLRAKKLPLPDDVMSDLVRFVVAHEVGHSLGLHHNMLGSNAYTVEQLRDPKFVAKNGVASSIMDYARFNYVIQPEDGVSPIDYTTGPYDNFAIEWGYKEFAGNLTAKQEVAKLNKIADRQLTNKYLRWDAYSAGSRMDPRIQTEDIGNDAMAATALGMKNLERIMANLVESASFEQGKGYDELANAYKVLISQYRREIGHVAKYVGGVMYRNELAQGHADQNIYLPVSIAKQKEALSFLAENAFKLPAFWNNAEVNKRIGYDKFHSAVGSIGARVISRILNSGIVDTQITMASAGLETYDPVELFSDVKGYVFEELKQRKPNVSVYRRNTQAAMVNILIAGLAPNDPRSRSRKSDDYRALCRSTLVALQKELLKAGNKNKGTMSGMHFLNLAATIEEAFDKK